LYALLVIAILRGEEPMSFWKGRGINLATRILTIFVIAGATRVTRRHEKKEVPELAIDNILWKAVEMPH